MNLTECVQGFSGVKLERRGRFIGKAGTCCLNLRRKGGGGGGMVFRDLRNFNLAMLAMQGCRFLQEQGSLLYVCFKARYFPQ